MLAIMRSAGEGFTIYTSDGPVRVVVWKIEASGGGVRLGIDAPKSVLVLRDELKRPGLDA